MTRTDPALLVRAIEPADVDGFVQLMAEERESLGGSRSPGVIRAVGRDGTKPAGSAVVMVAVRDGEVLATMVVLIGGSWYFWRKFSLRHPKAGLHLAAKRVRKLIRKRVGKEVPPAPPAPGRVAASLPIDLLDEPRLHVAARADGPQLRDEGPDLGYSAMVVVKSELRNQGVSKRLHQAAFAVLRQRGITRFRASFPFDHEPPIRMYLSLDMDIYRTNVGYVGSLDLVEGRWGRTDL